MGGPVGRADFAQHMVRAYAGARVLDIGCGPANVLAHLVDVDYTGLDISAEYIEFAKRRYGSRGRFWCSDVALAGIRGEQGTFDIVLATGVVHHLDNTTAAKLFELARQALRPGGRMIALDGCYVAGQSRVARWLLNRDRGKFVREPSEYVRLASASFSKVETCIKHDLIRIPYTHLIMRCSN